MHLQSPPEPRLETAKTRDGLELVLQRFGTDTGSAPAVILTHGTFSNGKLCLKLARHLADAGFDCWVLDWRGHGQSESDTGHCDYEQLAIRDVEAAVDHVRQQTRNARVFWVGHSAGGVLPFIYLARHPDRVRSFAGIVALGSQTTHAGRGVLAKLLLGVGKGLTTALGKAPGKLFRLGPEDEKVELMAQWFRWNSSGQWIGRDGFDYGSQLAAVDVPVLCFAGHGDTRIAPLAGCRALYDRLGSTDKTFVGCGVSEGFATDYTHAGLIAGPHAAAEVWPKIENWLHARCSDTRASAAEGGQRS